jgi:uncharacterized membrane protein
MELRSALLSPVVPSLEVRLWRSLAPLRTRTAFAIAALATGSAAALIVLGLRAVAVGELRFGYLVWNLFLAWIPLGLALVCVHRALWLPLRALTFALWLAFLPNAFYLVTDLIHLRERPPVPLWLDALVFQMYAFDGVLLGFVALYLVQAVVERRAGALAGWSFALGVLLLCGLGVYIGRFLRWNSWELFFDPVDFARRLAQLARHPLRDRTAFVAPLAFGGFYALAYLSLYALTGLRRRAPLAPR